ncbi:hypothetical protein [Lentzea albidocapillata]|uniref:Uncharacterized protein n=1 Tax=Lentzea albidocapillata TaxID=40571 RepID=A0A1W2DE78_9PSEU|nr:hypothetical protein [Lentzea albidocapillata]SMC95723.1 hypothetical protein SAMN05660733_02915 [Lentzea albidocapillata]
MTSGGADSIPVRVARGAARLDCAQPGWAMRVDVTVLDLQSTTDDLLGQIFGSHYNGIDTLGLTREASQSHGFYAHCASVDHGCSCDAEYARLTAEWARVVTSRQAATAVDRP